MMRTDSTGIMPRSVCETRDGKALGWMTGKGPVSDRPMQSNTFKVLTSNEVNVIADRSHLPMSRTRKASVVPELDGTFLGIFDRVEEIPDTKLQRERRFKGPEGTSPVLQGGFPVCCILTLCHIMCALIPKNYATDCGLRMYGSSSCST